MAENRSLTQSTTSTPERRDTITSHQFYTYQFDPALPKVVTGGNFDNLLSQAQCTRKSPVPCQSRHVCSKIRTKISRYTDIEVVPCRFSPQIQNELNLSGALIVLTTPLLAALHTWFCPNILIFIGI